MRLVHHSYSRIETVKQDFYPREQTLTCKPHGFWLSDDESNMSWEDWCTTENFRSIERAFKYDVHLTMDANILYIRNKFDLELFNKEYTTEHSHLDRNSYLSKYEKDWILVAQKYDGIVISPYMWDYRYSGDFSWYYGWDCASGCIWNTDKAIEKLEEIYTPITKNES